MGKNKIGLEVKGFEELIERLDENSNDVKEAVEECLMVAQETVASSLHTDIKRHNRTGFTEASIVEKEGVTWDGTTASIPVGFQFPEGLPSVFLMYGTPRMKKDTKLYNDIYGSRVKKKIAQKQEKILCDAIKKKIGG